MTTVIYKEILSDDVVRSIKEMSKKYPNVCEISSLPDMNEFTVWQETQPQYTITIESGSTATDYQTKRNLFGLVHKDLGPSKEAFIFFKTRKELVSFMQAFEAFVVDDEPFKTSFELG